jgi:hypothetical protein
MNALKREYFHVPLYAWAAGAIALALGLFYFMRTRTSSGASGGAQPALTPYPNPGGGGSAIPPSPLPIGGTTLPPGPTPLPWSPGPNWQPWWWNPQPQSNPTPQRFPFIKTPAPVVSSGGGGVPGLWGQGFGGPMVAAPANAQFLGAAFMPTRTGTQTTNLPSNAFPAPVARFPGQ